MVGLKSCNLKSCSPFSSSFFPPQSLTWFCCLFVCLNLLRVSCDVFWSYTLPFSSSSRIHSLSLPTQFCTLCVLQASRPICAVQVFLNVWFFRWGTTGLAKARIERKLSLLPLINISMARGGILAPTPIPMLGFGLTWVCTSYSLPLDFYTLSSPSSAMTPKLWEEGYSLYVPFRADLTAYDIVEDELGLLLLPSPPKCWDCRCIPSTCTSVPPPSPSFIKQSYQDWESTRTGTQPFPACVGCSSRGGASRENLINLRHCFCF